MTQKTSDQDALCNYYGRALQNGKDLKTGACFCDDEKFTHRQGQCWRKSTMRY